MKYTITIGRNKSWISSVGLGFLGAILSIVLLPFAAALLVVFAVVFPIADLLGFAGLERK